jgi:hypothetical protein
LTPRSNARRTRTDLSIHTDLDALRGGEHPPTLPITHQRQPCFRFLLLNEHLLIEPHHGGNHVGSKTQSFAISSYQTKQRLFIQTRLKACHT